MNFLGDDSSNITFNPRGFLITWCKFCPMIGLWHCRWASFAGNGVPRSSGDHLVGKCLFTVSRKMGRFAKFAFYKLKSSVCNFRKLSVSSNGKGVLFLIHFQAKTFVFGCKLQIKGGILGRRVRQMPIVVPPSHDHHPL